MLPFPVIRTNLSKIKSIDGKIVTHPITPNTTPFAITTPRSKPNVNVIKHNAINPAIVVIELPVTEASVSLIAFAIAVL